MTSWILMLALWGGHGVSVTTQQFSTESSCKQAGQAAVKMMEGAYFSVRYACTPKG